MQFSRSGSSIPLNIMRARIFIQEESKRPIEYTALCFQRAHAHLFDITLINLLAKAWRTPKCCATPQMQIWAATLELSFCHSVVFFSSDFRGRYARGKFSFSTWNIRTFFMCSVRVSKSFCGALNVCLCGNLVTFLNGCWWLLFLMVSHPAVSSASRGSPI